MDAPTENTEIQVAPAASAAPAPPLMIGKGGLEPTDMAGLWRLSKMVAASSLAPKGMDTPEDIFVAMSHGLEIGLKPMQSLQRIAVINGRPAVWGDAMMGLVIASGELENVVEEFVGEDRTDQYTAVCRVKRKGYPESVTTFSVADAKTAGLWTKAIWKQYPYRMLKMRARAYGLRDRFADVLGGMYMAEELQGEATYAKVVDNTTGDDDLSAALTAPPALPEPVPTEIYTVQGETPVAVPVAAGVDRDVIDSYAESIEPDGVSDDDADAGTGGGDELPFDVNEIGDMMDEEMAKNKTNKNN